MLGVKLVIIIVVHWKCSSWYNGVWWYSIQLNIACGTIKVEQRSNFELTLKDTPYLALTGKICDGFCLKFAIVMVPTSSLLMATALQWHHNEHDGISNHQPYRSLLNGLFRCRSKKTSKLRVTGLCACNSPGTGEFPTQMASNTENVSISWRHHERLWILWPLLQRTMKKWTLWTWLDYMCIFK